MSSASSRFLGGKPTSPEQVTNKPTLVPVPSAVNSFPLLFPPARVGEGAAGDYRWTPAPPGPGAAQSSGPSAGGARRYRGSGGWRSACGVRFTCTLGTSFPPEGSRPWLRPDGPRPREARPRVGPPRGQLPGAGAAGPHSPRGLQTASESREGLELFL